MCVRDLTIGIFGPAAPTTLARMVTSCFHTALVRAYADFVIRLDGQIAVLYMADSSTRPESVRICHFVRGRKHCFVFGGFVWKIEAVLATWLAFGAPDRARCSPKCVRCFAASSAGQEMAVRADLQPFRSVREKNLAKPGSQQGVLSTPRAITRRHLSS